MPTRREGENAPMPPRCCGDESAARGVRSLAAAGAAALHGAGPFAGSCRGRHRQQRFLRRRRKGRSAASRAAESASAQSRGTSADRTAQAGQRRPNGSRRRSGFMRRKSHSARLRRKRSRKPRSEKGPGLFCGGGAANYFRLKTRRTVSTACMVYSGLAASWKRSFMKEMGS